MSVVLVENETLPVAIPAQRTAFQTGRPARASAMTSTVPRELVHRAAVAEVFLTGWSRTAENQFALTAQWPRAHSYFTPVNGCYDPLLASETIRQVGTLLSHAEFGVPFGDQFLMWDLHHSVRPELAGVGAAPADLELDVICSDIRRRGRRLAGMRYEVTLSCGGQVIATGGAAFDCTSPAVYQRLRGDRAGATGVRPLPQPLAPASVGRFLTSDVVLSATGRPLEWQLRVDEQHPVLFDHPVDHVPGMVLMESARQAAQAIDPSRPFLPTTMRSEFSRYAELDRPSWIRAEPLPAAGNGDRQVRVTGHQDGSPVFSCLIGTLGAAE